MAVKSLREAQEDTLRDLHFVTNEHGISVPATRIEPARTNSLLQSEDFTASAWAAVNASVTPDQSVAPNSSQSMDRIENTGGDDAGARASQSVAISGGETLACSGYVKAASSEYAHASIRTDADASIGNILVHLSGEGSVVDASKAPVRVGVNHVVSDIYRVWIVADAGATATVGSAVYGPAKQNSDLGNVPTSDLGDSIDAWGAQLEVGASFPSSYLATGGSSTARAVEDVSDDVSIDQQELTVYAKFVNRGIFQEPEVGQQTAFWIGQKDSTDRPWMQVQANGGGKLRFIHGTSTNNSLATPNAAANYGDVVEVRMVLHADGSIDAGVAVNGGSEVTAADGTTADMSGTFTEVQYGARADGDDVGALDFIARPYIESGEKTMDEMRALAGVA